MSESAEIIRRLVAGGANYAAIGRALDRDRSLVRQIAVGKKPGANLESSLRQLEAQLGGGTVTPARVRAVEVEKPARRTTRTGQAARTRRVVSGRGWQTSKVSKQAARSGARSLDRTVGRAAGEGQELAVSITFDRSVTVQQYLSKGKHVPGLGGTADFKLGDAEQVAAELAESGLDFTAYVAQAAIDAGLVDWASDGIELSAHVVGIELRAF